MNTSRPATRTVPELAPIRAALLVPTDDPSQSVRLALAAAGPGATCAALPEGPYVVPYLPEPARV